MRERKIRNSLPEKNFFILHFSPEALLASAMRQQVENRLRCRFFRLLKGSYPVVDIFGLILNIHWQGKHICVFGEEDVFGRTTEIYETSCMQAFGVPCSGSILICITSVSYRDLQFIRFEKTILGFFFSLRG